MVTKRMGEHGRRPLSALLLLVFVAASLLPSSLVLCLETDGHVTLETSSDGRSCASSASLGLGTEVPSDRGGLVADGQHCRVCTDIPLGSSGDRFLLQSGRPDLVAGRRVVPERATAREAAIESPAPASGRGDRVGSGAALLARSRFLESVRLLV